MPSPGSGDSRLAISRFSVFKIPRPPPEPSNRWLNRAIAWELLLIVAIVHVPFFQRLFATSILGPFDWMVVVLAAASIIPVVELAKWMERRGWFGALD